MNNLHELEKYTTAKSARSPLAAMLPSVSFYAGLISEVVRSAYLAKAGRYGNPEWGTSSQEMMALLERVGVDIEITGFAHLRNPDTGPCVIIGNHMSFLETLLLPGVILPKPLTFVIKQSLLEYPIFKHVMRVCNPVAVTRSNPRQDLKTVLEEGVKRLEDGISVVVFPQATRSHAFDPDKMGSIGVKLAKKANVPILPMALKTDALQNGTLIKDFGAIRPEIPLRIAFDEPIRVSAKGNEEMTIINSFIEEKLASWGH